MELLIDAFDGWLAATAGIRTTPSPRPEADLPAVLRRRYDLHRLAGLGSEMTAVTLRESEGFSPAAFEKDLAELPSDVRQGFVLVASDLEPYVRARLAERGLPFVVPGVQAHWPALGVAVRARRTEAPPPARAALSPATQAVVIGSLVGVMPAEFSVGAAARLLGYSAMTMTRAFRELEAAGLAEALRSGHERRLRFLEGGRELWAAARPRLANPIRRIERVPETALPFSGALRAGPGAYPALQGFAAAEAVHAVGPGGWARIRWRTPPAGSGRLLQVWSYEPAFAARAGRVDPFSLRLALGAEGDVAAAAALDAMLETW